MADLRQQLEECFRGRVCLVGVGNVELGDDGVGVRLVEALCSADFPVGANSPVGKPALQVEVAGTAPERYLGKLMEGDFDHIVFMDAAEFGSAPGAVVWLDAGEMEVRYPQVSTHKISLGLLARCLAGNGGTQVWLLGVQPGSCRRGSGLSAQVASAVEALIELMCSVVGQRKSEIRNPKRSRSLHPGVLGGSGGPNRKPAGWCSLGDSVWERPEPLETASLC